MAEQEQSGVPGTRKQTQKKSDTIVSRTLQTRAGKQSKKESDTIIPVIAEEDLADYHSLQRAREEAALAKLALQEAVRSDVVRLEGPEPKEHSQSPEFEQKHPVQDQSNLPAPGIQPPTHGLVLREDLSLARSLAEPTAVPLDSPPNPNGMPPEPAQSARLPVQQKSGVWVANLACATNDNTPGGGGLATSEANSGRFLNEAKAAVEAMMKAAGAESRGDNSYCLKNYFIHIIISPMTQGPDHRQQRIDAVAAQIHAVAAGLPDPEEQREAEVKALVTSVPSKVPYSEQLKAFTGITHVMRVMMARQLEPKLREHLQTEGPEPDPATGAAERKRTFAESITDGLFRLGLGIGWDTKNDLCYLTATRAERNALGIYKLIPRGKSTAIKTVAGWSEKQVAHGNSRVTGYANQITLRDAAPPSGDNCLSPISR